MELETENVKNIRSLALCKYKLKVQTSIAEEMEKMAGTYRTSYAEAVKDLYEKNKAIRRQKYKRCLNNAWWCLMEEFFAEDCRCERCVDWSIKWHKRWIELAEQFKEEK